MKGKIIYKVLDLLRNGAQDQADFINAVIRAGYGASSAQLDYQISKLQDKRTTLLVKKQKITNFRKYLSKLKQQGFISQNNQGGVFLKEKGKKKLNDFDNSISFKEAYAVKRGDRVIVISYDIPVAFNRERNILRGMLAALGFNLVHKSVWVGKVALPARLIADLSNLGIIDFVEILEVTKNGTLKSKN